MRLTTAQIERRLQRFVEASRRDGQKVTIQRMEILRALASTEEHPDAEAIFTAVRERLPTISLDTVYRNLAMLQERGLVKRLDLASGRARYDGNEDLHHHFICSSCGLVRDIYSEELDELAPPDDIRSWGEVQSRQVHFHGICRACSRGKRAVEREHATDS